MPCRDSGLRHDTRNIMGASGNVFERPPAQEGLSSTIFNNSKNLASSSQELRPDTVETATKKSEMKRESLNTKISSTYFQSRSGLLKHIGGTYSHNGTMEYPLKTPGRSLVRSPPRFPSERGSERPTWRVDHTAEDRWRPPLVDAGWHAFCQAIYKGIEGSDWGELHEHYKEMSRAAGVRMPNESRKAKTLWKMKAARDRRENLYDPESNDNILGRNETRLELWEEHLKDVMVALDKALKCVENWC